CHDIGKKLGCGAHMSFLLRTATGIFNLENGIDIERLQSFKDNPERAEDYLLSVDEALKALPAGYAPKKLEDKLKNGVRINLADYCKAEELELEKLIRIYVGDEFLGIARCRSLDPLEVKMEKLFNI
ncbi:tRNA pseudouridine(55) synthase TruB, partial [Aduncisulcus paluster]